LAVGSRVEPPAPKVTETNAGARPFKRCAVARSAASPASVFGGKNSNDTLGVITNSFDLKYEIKHIKISLCLSINIQRLLCEKESGHRE
jgi:hypothetical protein